MKIKKFLSLLASLAMMVTAVTGTMTVSVVSAADGIAASGKCGEKAEWFINSDGVLVVSGEGSLYNYEKDWGWMKYNKEIEEVVVEDGITNLTYKDYSPLIAFGPSYCCNFSKIIFPPSLTNIYGMLYDSTAGSCVNLTDIYVYSRNISDADKIYSDYAVSRGNQFAGSGIIWHIYKGSATETSLREGLHLTDEDIAYIPDREQMPTVTNREPVKLEPLTETSGPSGLLSKWEWEDSSKTLTFSGSGEISIADDYKNYANKTEHIVIESGITSLNASAGSVNNNNGSFTGFTALKDIKLPNTLKNIGDCSFYQTPITKIINGLPEGLISIGRSAFRDSNLEEISFPESLNGIGESAFLGTKIKSINLHEGMWIGGSAFKNCQSLKKVTVPKNVTFASTSEGGQGMNREHATFSNCTELEKIVIEEGCLITDSWSNVKSENGLAENFCKGCSSLKTVVIGGNVNYIPQQTFGNCVSLSDIYFYTKDLSTIEKKGANDGNNESIDTSNNPAFHVVKGSTTEQTLKDAGYLTADNTVYLADTTALETAISEAETIETDKYTDESVSEFTKAIENAKAVLENLDATQEEVDKAVQAINDAKNALADKSGEPSSDNTSDPSNSSGNNNQSQSPNTPATPSTSAPTTATPKPITPPTVTTATKPAKVKAVKVKAKKKKLNVSWKKVSGATGYEVLSATNNKFTKNKKTVTVKKNKVTLKKLKPKKKYFVKVRAYKLANGNKYFGKWSKVVKKKVK